MWFKDTESKTFDELGVSSARFEPLDTQLAAALNKTLPQQLRIRAPGKELEACKKDTPLTRRHIVHVIYDWFKTDAHTAAFFSFTDLQTLAWLGDKPADIEKLSQSWDHTLANLQYAMPDECLRGLASRQAEEPQALKEDMAVGPFQWYVF